MGAAKVGGCELGSFFVFSALKVAIGMLLLVMGWKLFRLVIALWAAVTVGTIAAGVALAGGLENPPPSPVPLPLADPPPVDAPLEPRLVA